MMLKKEREVVSLMEKYLDSIREWQRTALEAVLTYFMGDLEMLKLAVLSKNQFQATAEMTGSASGASYVKVLTCRQFGAICFALRLRLAGLPIRQQYAVKHFYISNR